MRLTLAATFVLSLAAAAACQAADFYAFGNRVLVIGDSVGKLSELADAPIHKEPIENTFGAHEGERWEYRHEGKTLLVTVKEGKVTQMDEVY